MRNLLRPIGKLRASYIWHLPRKTIVVLITGYQHTLSPDHGPLRHLFPYGCCVYEETCSSYGKRVIMERGVIVGSLLTFKRVLSCNPLKKPSEKKMLKTLLP